MRRNELASTPAAWFVYINRLQTLWMIVTRSVRVSSITDTALWCLCAFFFVSEQTLVRITANSLLLLLHGTIQICSDYCSGIIYSSAWAQCCTGDLCNNLTISANISSLSELKNCYKGSSIAEYTGTSAFVQKFRVRWVTSCTSIGVILVLRVSARNAPLLRAVERYEWFLVCQIRTTTLATCVALAASDTTQLNTCTAAGHTCAAATSAAATTTAAAATTTAASATIAAPSCTQWRRVNFLFGRGLTFIWGLTKITFI